VTRSEAPQATVLLVSENPERFQRLQEALARDGRVELLRAATGAGALEAAARRPPVVAVVDERLPDMDGLTLVRRLLEVSAWIQTVVASPLEPEAFHEKTEGLGIMAQCSPAPDASESASLAEKIRRACPP
jgi:CheY-like chemotaxis protein